MEENEELNNTQEEVIVENNSTSGICIASLVLGIVTLLLCAVPLLGLILGIVALVVSIIAFRKINTNNERNGMAIGGLVTSIIGLVIGLIITLVVGIGAIGTAMFFNNKTQTVYDKAQKAQSQYDRVQKELEDLQDLYDL